ncbi:neural/ectodermal development factor IMP-L2 [Trichogramma pretiosum]|uniref:Ig-like domain-containing protein n=1 Tax=Trichogramma kaykai TaxID=54128 RepID=A0ABD2VZC7_9HYME|nr:neural/ectodermal development factor IMP-L2 [Trichogramma pretiosum]
MNRGKNSLVAIAVSLLLLSSTCRSDAFSLSRTLHDVGQDVAEDASLYSQEMRVNVPEINLSTGPKKSSNYVSIKKSPPSVVDVLQGNRLELVCDVDGSPPPKVYWIMGDNPQRKVAQLEREGTADVSYTAISRELSRLVIDCVTPLDHGVVHCVAVSGDKMLISPPTVINVIDHEDGGQCKHFGDDRETPVITRHRPIYFSEMGSTVELPCEASGNPRPKVHWYNGEGKRLDDPRFSVQADGSLVIADIRWQDMDGYKCVASSPLTGHQAEAVTFLYPAAKSEAEKRKANAL